MGAKLNLRGQVFERWTVLTGTTEKNISGSYYWKCQCVCGAIKKIASAQLMSGQSKSCGCLSTDVNRQLMTGKPSRNTKPPGHVSGRKVYKTYIDNCKKKGVEFKIPLDIFFELTSMNCYYCGIQPLQFVKSASDKGDYLYNGLDRVEHSKGYFVDNVVPCCIKCNRAKFRMSQNEFV